MALDSLKADILRNVPKSARPVPVGGSSGRAIKFVPKPPAKNPVSTPVFEAKKTVVTDSVKVDTFTRQEPVAPKETATPKLDTAKTVSPLTPSPPKVTVPKAKPIQVPFQYNAKKGVELVQYAEAYKNPNDTNTCARYVRETLERAGLTKGERFNSAYQWANALAKNPKFKEIKVAQNDLRKLPPGAVIVWPQYVYPKDKKAYEHGHIGISNGKGQEISYAKYNIKTSGNPRVFIPVL